MGETSLQDFPITFNRSITVEARPERLTSDAGALVLREIDERIGLTDILARKLLDRRNQDYIVHPLVELLRTRIYMMALGWNGQDDADFLRDDPAMRLSVSERKGQSPLLDSDGDEDEREEPEGLASQPTFSRLVEALSVEQNLNVLRECLCPSVGAVIRAERKHRLQNCVIDVDSFPIEVHGCQSGSEYNGHYHKRMFHPLVAMLHETEDIIGALLRKGAVHTASGLDDFLMPILDKVEKEICVVAAVRGDAGMPGERLLGKLEDGKHGYCFRLKSNQVLERLAEPILKRLPSRKADGERISFHELSYAAESWSRERRVVLVVLDSPGELFPRYFFLLTNWSEEQIPGDKLLEFYRRRGTLEGHIGEFINALSVALSCTSRPKKVYGDKQFMKKSDPRTPEEQFACNDATFMLYVWAYNLANRLRLLAEVAMPLDRGPNAKPREGGWSLYRVQQLILRAAARVLLHSRKVVIVLGQATARIWNALSRHLARLPRVKFEGNKHAVRSG